MMYSHGDGRLVHLVVTSVELLLFFTCIVDLFLDLFRLRRGLGNSIVLSFDDSICFSLFTRALRTRLGRGFSLSRLFGGRGCWRSWSSTIATTRLS